MGRQVLDKCRRTHTPHAHIYARIGCSTHTLRVYARTHAHSLTHTYTRKHAQTHPSTHTCTHTRTHTRTQTQNAKCSNRSTGGVVRDNGGVVDAGADGGGNEATAVRQQGASKKHIRNGPSEGEATKLPPPPVLKCASPNDMQGRAPIIFDVD